MGDGISKQRAVATNLDVNKIIDLGIFTIEGKVAKPDVFYVLSRATVKYDGNITSPSFMPKILGSVKKNPF